MTWPNSMLYQALLGKSPDINVLPIMSELGAEQEELSENVVLTHIEPDDDGLVVGCSSCVLYTIHLPGGRSM